VSETADAGNGAMLRLLRRVEEAVDAIPTLTRAPPSGFSNIASFTFDESGWSVRVHVRNLAARGRGSRGFYKAQGNGETPEQAVASFLERLPHFLQATL
jgi:hypothetical protein